MGSRSWSGTSRRCAGIWVTLAARSLSACRCTPWPSSSSAGPVRWPCPVRTSAASRPPPPPIMRSPSSVARPRSTWTAGRARPPPRPRSSTAPASSPSSCALAPSASTPCVRSSPWFASPPPPEPRPALSGLRGGAGVIPARMSLRVGRPGRWDRLEVGPAQEVGRVEQRLGGEEHWSRIGGYARRAGTRPGPDVRSSGSCPSWPEHGAAQGRLSTGR
ncbi:hypothetical protein FAIPA1_360028 [Frankia sp. AiPs1]